LLHESRAAECTFDFYAGGLSPIGYPKWESASEELARNNGKEASVLLNRNKRIKKLLLHVGPPKTATTSLQKVFYDERELLKKNGILVPHSGGPLPGQHFSLLNELVDSPKILPYKEYYAGHLDYESITEEFDKAEADCLLLSGEVFANHEINWALRIIEYLNPETTELLFTLRSPGSWVPSAQSQRLISGNLALPLFSKAFVDAFVSTYLPQIRENISEVISTTSTTLTLVSMERGGGSSVIDFYARALGLSGNFSTVPTENTRVPPCQTKVRSAIHTLLASEGLPLRIKGDINYYLIPLVEAEFSQHLCSGSCYEYLDGDLSQQVISAVSDWQAGLISDATRIIGDPQKVVCGSSDSIALVPRPNDLDMETAARIITRGYVGLVETTARIWDELQQLKVGK